MDSTLSSNGFLLMKKYIEDQCGIVIDVDKSYLIESRLSKLFIDSKLSNFEEFYYKITASNDSMTAEKVVDAITTNETLWFRDKTPWEVMENIFLPECVEKLRKEKKDKIRIWSAASSTGQEPYSIAICVDNYLKTNNIYDIKLSRFDIIATDISNTVVEMAKRGRFDGISINRGLSSSYKDIYFKFDGKTWILNDEIRNAVTFSRFNLKKNFGCLGNFDIVFCRYVVIYFSKDLKNDILNRIAQILNPKGILFLGSSELFSGYDQSYDVEYYNNGIYYRKR